MQCVFLLTCTDVLCVVCWGGPVVLSDSGTHCTCCCSFCSSFPHSHPSDCHNTLVPLPSPPLPSPPSPPLLSPPSPLQWTSASYIVGMGWDTQERLICVAENGQVFIYSIHGEFVAQNNILHDVRGLWAYMRGRVCDMPLLPFGTTV